MSYLNKDELNDLEDERADPSPRLVFVDYAGRSIEELMELKMEKGHRKYGDPANYEWTEMVMRFNRHIGEWLISSEGFDHHTAMLEAIADICNVGRLLFPKLQELYIEERERMKQAIDEAKREPSIKWNEEVGAEEARRFE